MTLATRALGASATMPDDSLDQRPADDLAADWQSFNQSRTPLE
jgi:hypothetical protein